MKKKILLIGGGGREHAITWKLRQSSQAIELYVAPGNAGTSTLAENVPIKATDIDGLLAFALEKKIDFTIVGQDDPLAMGIVDAFRTHDLLVFGPTQASAQIEASKVFSKRLMKLASVPTASYAVFNNYDDGLAFVHEHFNQKDAKPIVLKASGLTLGKGVYVCENIAAAEAALKELMVDCIHGSAAKQVVIESFIRGQEVSMHAFCDDNSFVMFPSSQDHKTIFDGDKGPNTGGMGTIAPVPWFVHQDFVSQRIVSPILAEMKREGCPFKGLLFPGIKVSPEDGPMVLEFNARFGDPETQVYMRLLKTDLLEILEACVEGRLHEINIEWNTGFAACVVMASEGYPSTSYKKGLLITGIDEAELLPNVVVFQAGTQFVNDKLVTSGGRVLGVTGIGTTLKEALDNAYKGIECIQFEGAQYRKDIGAKSLNVA